MEDKRGNIKEALEYLQEAIWAIDSIQKITETEAVAKINSLYNYQHTEAENARLLLNQEKQRNLIIVLILSALGIALGGIILSFQQKAKRLEAEKMAERFQKAEKDRYEKSEAAIRDNEQRIKELQDLLDKATEERDSLKTEQLQIQKKRLQARNTEIALQQEEARLQINAFRHTSIYKEFQQAAKDGKPNLQNEESTKKWQELKEAINMAYPDFTENIQALCPSLSDKEIKVCLLSKSDISPSGVAEILKCSRQAITNIRTRLYKKITSYGNNFKDFDHFISSL